MLEIKRISNNIWKLIEKRQPLKVHLGKRKQDPDCHRSGKIRSLDKVLFKKKKERKGKKRKEPCGLETCTRKQTNLAWLPNPAISTCMVS